jgi:uncharacterized protein
MRPLVVERGAREIDRLLGFLKGDLETQDLVDSGYSEALLRTLFDHRILRGTDEDPLVESPAEPLVPAPKTQGMSLYLLLSQGCNLACVYCLNGEGTYRRTQAPKMSAAVAFRSVERCMERLEDGGRLEIVFFGGEPLLNWPLAEEVIAFVEREMPQRYPGKTWHFHLTSNLATLPTGLLKTLNEHQISVLCDVDGPPEVHDLTRPFKNGRPSGERIASNVRRLVGAGIPVALRATITSRNVHHMGDIARYHKAIGGSGTSAVAVNAVNSDEDFLDEDLLPDPDLFAEGLRQMLSAGFEMHQVFPFNQFAGTLRPDLYGQAINCGAPWGNTPVVDIDGEVYACIYLVGIDAYRIGNMCDGSSYPDMQALTRMMELVAVDHIEGCKDCIYRYPCGGGCAVGTLLVAGSPAASGRVRDYQRQVRCKSVRVIVEETLWDVARRAERGGPGES